MSATSKPAKTSKTAKPVKASKPSKTGKPAKVSKPAKTGKAVKTAAVPPAPQLSVVIPCKNEAENLPGLIAEVAEALKGRALEILVIDDGSTDGTADAAHTAGANTGATVRVLSHAQSAGQSAAVRTGVLHARGAIILCTDGDGQNDPAFMPALVDTLEERGPGFGMVGGQRVGRKASGFKRFASRFANRLRGAMLADKTTDSGCGLKAVRADLFRRLPYFDGWHRFMAALVLREGYDVDFVDVVDRPRRFGVSKYGVLDRALIGAIDLFGVWWLMRRHTKRPVVSQVAPPAAAPPSAQALSAPASAAAASAASQPSAPQTSKEG